MPVYEYQCSQGHRFERILAAQDYLEPQRCACGFAAEKRIFSAPRVFSDYEGYESPASGKWISGRRERTEDLARTGCRPYEVGMRQDAERRRVAEDRELDSFVDAVTEQTLAEITS